jgi:hypothetical protein
MKRYIKSSFDPSIPSWLKKSIDNQRYNKLSDRLVARFGVALSDAQFLDHEEPNSTPIYLINGDYSSAIYVPGVNDDDTIQLNGRSRKLGAISKAKLPSLATDVVWLDLSNKVQKKDRYQDPRRIYDGAKDNKGRYAGQYYTEPWTSYDGEEHPGKWSKSGNSGRYSSRTRDKSGYEVPTPESRLERYYETFPEKVTEKVDAIYDRLIAVRDEVLNPELINTPYDRDEEMSIGNAIYRLRDAIDEYRRLIAMLDRDTGKLSNVDSWMRESVYKEFSEKISRISNQLDEAEKSLTSRW